MSPAFITEADVIDVALDGFATKQALFPAFSFPVVFARWNPTLEQWFTTAPQYVVRKDAERQERTTTDDAGQSVTIDGWLQGYAPMDVERGDLFALGDTGDEERAEIIQVRPARLGTQRAAYRLRLGEA